MLWPVCEAADVLVRLRAGVRTAIEVRVAIIGNVDSGETHGLVVHGLVMAHGLVMVYGSVMHGIWSANLLRVIGSFCTDSPLHTERSVHI